MRADQRNNEETGLGARMVWPQVISRGGMTILWPLRERSDAWARRLRNGGQPCDLVHDHLGPVTGSVIFAIIIRHRCNLLR